MNKSLVRSAIHSPYASVSSRRILISFLVTLTIVFISTGAMSQDSRPHEIGAIGNVKFSVPAGFRIQPSRDSEVAIMKADAYEGGLFVATSERSIPSEKDLMELSRRLIAEFFPEESGFSWKVLPRAPIPKLSVHQQNQFVVKAVNTNKFVQAEFVLLRREKRNLFVGLVTRFGSDRDFKFLYEVDGTEYSFEGWRGMYELLDSIKRD